jgi:predicted phosphoribosyltransferase
MPSLRALTLADFFPARCLFRDRVDAGRHLAAHLEAFRGPDTLVLGIPRGGVPVAAEVARHLGAELDVLVARKLGAPGHPELALGAVTATGARYLDERGIRALGVEDWEMQAAVARELAEARRREQRFRLGRPEPHLAGRTVLLVDDGLATGATALAAVRAARHQGPARLVVAAPVGSTQACATLRAEADAVVCPHTPEPFLAVGLHYDDFSATEDDEVVRLLEAAARPA